MTDNKHSITPPPELVASLRNSAPHGIRDAGVTREIWLINHAYAAGADAELEAWYEWVVCDWTDIETADKFRAARRPKLPSLKEQALMALEDGDIGRPGASLTPAEVCIIRRALEALPE